MKKLLILILFSSVFLFAEESSSRLQSILNKQTDFRKELLEFAKQNSYSIEGQTAYLELAKTEILKRNYKKAIEYLQKINKPKLQERHFWLAKSYLETDKFHRSIIAAQNYITNSENNDRIEIAYFLIAEAYIKQEMYKRALNTLETLRQSKYINNNIPFLHFKIGNCYEHMGKNFDALKHYKKIQRDFPYTNISYLAEEKIDTLVNSDNDLNELFAEGESNDHVKKLKLYLQVGAFNSQENADNYKKVISSYGYPIVVFPKIKDNEKLFVVAVGPYEEDKKIKKIAAELQERDIDSFVLKRY